MKSTFSTNQDMGTLTARLVQVLPRSHMFLFVHQETALDGGNLYTSIEWLCPLPSAQCLPDHWLEEPLPIMSVWLIWWHSGYTSDLLQLVQALPCMLSRMILLQTDSDWSSWCAMSRLISFIWLCGAARFSPGTKLTWQILRNWSLLCDSYIRHALCKYSL